MATVSDRETGEVLERLGPFDSPGAARVACGLAAGVLLQWERQGLAWEARTADRVYLVPREVPHEAPKD